MVNSHNGRMHKLLVYVNTWADRLITERLQWLIARQDSYCIIKTGQLTAQLDLQQRHSLVLHQ